jgi:hypothetical protein
MTTLGARHSVALFSASPSEAWGGVREADGGVMSRIATHDPSGNAGHLPAHQRGEEYMSATEWRAPGKEARRAIHA